jgi:hypothetical protein
LGDAYAGFCRAPGSAGREKAEQPDETRLRAVCNVGYGRQSCEQFPPSSAADAIRFHVVAEQGELIRIQYVFEKECWPAQHGDFEYTAARGLAPTLVDETLARQAAAFIESYQKRRTQA